MKLSVITPTHRADHLKRLETSLSKQTLQDFEWILVPNGALRNNRLDISIKQARVIPPHENRKEIGYLKQFGSFAAKGEFLVEVDHDDELIPTALEEIYQAFQGGADFVYSNFCNIHADGKSSTFGAQNGWESREFVYEGKTLIETIAFAPSPATFSKIWYAPNHVRAWRRSFYIEIGGHNPEMSILDDQDLLSRTYINGTVHHIDRPLYLYHIHDQNTCYGEVNAQIQVKTLELHDQYIYKLVERWCDINKLRKIDLCGGFNPPAGYESVDMANSDIVADLNKPWPFEDGSVGVFRAHDALEHLSDPIHVMKEAYRCLAPNGWFLILVPSTDGRGAFQDPTHVSFWNSNSFWYYTKAETAKYIGTPVRFQLNRIKNFYPSAWQEENKIVYTKADLLKFEGRTPGLIEI